MLVIRHFIATSCGVLIALVYGGNAIADQSFSFEQSTSNSSLKLKKQAKFLAQEESDNIDEKIQPSANPLFFPTQPEEVEIDLTQPITLEDAIRLALRNNNDIAQARLNLERSLASLKQAKAALYPTLSTQLEFNYTESPNLERTVKIDSEEGGSIDVLRQNRDLAKLAGDQAAVDDLNEQIERAIDTDTISIDGDITLNYDVYTGGGRSATIRQAEKQVEFNRLDLERITAQVRFEAVSNYYQLQNNDAEVEIAQAAIEDAKQTLRDAQLLERAGLGTRFDVLRAEVELANANQSLILAIAEQKTARRQLAETLNVSQKVDLVTADEIAEAGDWEFPLEETIILAYKNRAELEQFLVQREIDEAQKQIALSQIRPQISLFASYDLLDVLDNDDVDLTDGYTVGARLRWQFFDGGASKAGAKQEEIDAELAEVRFSDQKNTIRLQVEEAFYNFTANKENIKTATLAVKLAEESLRLARLRFQAGVGTQTEVIQTQSELTTARGNRLRAIIDYNQSLNQLLRAVTNLPDNELFDLP